MELLVGEAETLVITSYQSEFEKIDNIAEIMTKLINDYKERLQEKLT